MKRCFSTALNLPLKSKSTYKLTVKFDGDTYEGSAFMKGMKTLEGELIYSMHKANLLKNSNIPQILCL